METQTHPIALKALNIHLLYNITGLSFDHNSREIQTRSTSLILIPPETGWRVLLPHRDSHRDEVVDENGKFRGLGNENARGCRVITPRRRWGGSFGNRKDRWRGKGALEGGLGRRVLIHGISADYTRQPSKKKKKKKKGERNRDMENEFCNVEGSSRVRRRSFAVEETSSLYRFEQFESKNWLAWTSWIIWIGEELVGFDMNEHSVLFYRGEFIIGVEKLREERRSLWENRVSLELLEREIERVCVKDW